MFTCVNCKRTRVELCICVLQIYTGSNDGSVQAVKINLMKNFRCWVRADWLFFPLSLSWLLRDLFSAPGSPNSVAELLSDLRH